VPPWQSCLALLTNAAVLRPLSRTLSLGCIVGYLVAGIAIGPESSTFDLGLIRGQGPRVGAVAADSLNLTWRLMALQRVQPVVATRRTLGLGH
jgi:Kef-type K+ transport system membrane component KefB